MIKEYKVWSDGEFSLLKAPYKRKQHPNQQLGLDTYVKVLDHRTHNINILKLYENSKGLFFKKDGPHYLSNFTKPFLYIPFQMIELEE